MATKCSLEGFYFIYFNFFSSLPSSADVNEISVAPGKKIKVLKVRSCVCFLGCIVSSSVTFCTLFSLCFPLFPSNLQTFTLQPSAFIDALHVVAMWSRALPPITASLLLSCTFPRTSSIFTPAILWRHLARLHCSSTVNHLSLQTAEGEYSDMHIWVLIWSF